MDFTGRFDNLMVDLLANKQKAVLTINEDARQTFDELKDSELSIVIKKYRKKRSLDANAYAWVLMTKLANMHGTSKEEIYEQMLQRYGTLYEDENGSPVVMTTKKTTAIENLKDHWLFYKDNGTFASYLMIKGSSDYDTKEMSVFIDGVVSECVECGIEVLTPDEIEQMKQKWGVDIGE